MTQDEIMDMARQAGFEKVIYINPNTGIKTIQAYDSNSLEAFAKLVAAKERDIMCKQCIWSNDEKTTCNEANQSKILGKS